MNNPEDNLSLRETPLPVDQWEWFGMAAHFICGRWCRFHMATKIGNYVISSVGYYVHPHHTKASEQGEADWLKQNPLGADIGLGRKFETMVFRFTKYCDAIECNCGVPRIDPVDLDFKAANTIREARDNHMELCKKWAQYV